MPIYEITSDQLRKIEETSFSDVGVRERVDLQRLLRSQIEVVAPNTLVIAEEFSNWGGDSRRRIDLLAIDKNANLVVVELKRTEDGGHMELQALRYAAMVSTMTFEQAVDFYAEYLKKIGSEEDARSAMLDFLELEQPDEEHFAEDVRIVLVSAEFLKELTTTVLWLNGYGIDLRCVRLKPYKDGGRTFVDVQQVIPLPEAADYQVQVDFKTKQKRASRATTRDLTKYDVTINGITGERLAKRNAIFLIVSNLCSAGVKPEQITELIHWRTKGLFLVFDGRLSAKEFVAKAALQRETNGRQFEPRRWFLDESELIYSAGRTYSFSNQWGDRWLDAMSILMGNFPNAGIRYEASRLD